MGEVRKVVMEKLEGNAGKMLMGEGGREQPSRKRMIWPRGREEHFFCVCVWDRTGSLVNTAKENSGFGRK